MTGNPCFLMRNDMGIAVLWSKIVDKNYFP